MSPGAGEELPPEVSGSEHLSFALYLGDDGEDLVSIQGAPQNSVPFFYSHFFSIAFFSSRISFTIISTAPTIRPASTIIPA